MQFKSNGLHSVAFKVKKKVRMTIVALLLDYEVVEGSKM